MLRLCFLNSIILFDLCIRYSDVRTAAELTGLAVYIEEAYGLDIFNPTITDIDKIDVKRATAFYRNRSGNFMTAQV